jgi:hypothetical protein
MIDGYNALGIQYTWKRKDAESYLRDVAEHDVHGGSESVRFV